MLWAIWWSWARILSCMGIIRWPELIFFSVMFSLPLWCHVLMSCVKGVAAAWAFQESHTHPPPKTIIAETKVVLQWAAPWANGYLFPHSHTHTRALRCASSSFRLNHRFPATVSGIGIYKSKEFNRMVQQQVSLSWMPSERDHEQRNPQAICLRLHICPSCALNALF